MDILIYYLLLNLQCLGTLVIIHQLLIEEFSLYMHHHALV